MKTILIAAVGDILMWRRQIASAKREGGKSYSFDAMFREVAPYLRRADLTIGNLETTLSGREAVYQKRHKKTGWPMFNCPDELAGALKRSGFNLLTTANNHCMDRGIHGLKRTLNVLDRHGLRHTGTFQSRADSTKLLVTNVKGVRVGVLAYTHGTNNIPVPKDHTWAVNRIWAGKIQNDITRMRKHADLVIVVLHFGQEFHRFPNQKQKSLVKQLFSDGADVVLGVHPHVLQPMSFRTARERNGRVAKKFVIYSLGNFVSDSMLGNIHSDSGVIVNLTVTKDDKGVIRVRSIQTVPTWVHKFPVHGSTRFRVLPVGPFLKRPDQKLTAGDTKIMRRVLATTSRHLRI